MRLAGRETVPLSIKSRKQMKRTLPFVIITLVLASALLAAWYMKRSTGETSHIAPPASPTSGNRASSIKLGADPPQTLGTADAPVMLEEFGDFECQSCGLLHPILQQMKAEFGSRLVIVFREYPLAAKHEHALAAARAAEAAGLQGKFWEMHNRLYENQKAWHESSSVQTLFEEYAEGIGLALDRFKQDMSSEIVEERIALDRERGQSIGINSTPTVFLNGREVPLASLSADSLRELIKAQIASGGN